MTIAYPAGLRLGLHSGRQYQTVSPLMRSELNSGRARQRRKFTDVPVNATINWLFSDTEGLTFESWFRDTLIDGTLWFECPLALPFGFETYTARFTDIYSGPNRVGPDLWSYSAVLELRERPLLQPGWSEFPEFVLAADIIDRAVNLEWPMRPWQIYIETFDTTINQDWPTP